MLAEILLSRKIGALPAKLAGYLISVTAQLDMAAQRCRQDSPLESVVDHDEKAGPLETAHREAWQDVRDTPDRQRRAPAQKRLAATLTLRGRPPPGAEGGYHGSRQVVRKHLAARRAGTAEPVRADIPSPRKITSWIMRPRDTLTESQDKRLLDVRLACPDITRACDIARTFADLVRHRCGYPLPG